MTFNFERDPESGIILVGIFLDGRCRLKVVVDTGASNTTLDRSALYIANYDLQDALGLVEIETANGVVQTEIVEIQELTALGITRRNFPVQVFDFLSHGVLSDYQGLLGMDFFEGTKFCIDTVNSQISVETP
ncbi:MAG: clan AA aspartic protease [Saprospiraceae bacterium]|nr:clan AA aspartic protease [Saprospiraceae bacterium]